MFLHVLGVPRVLVNSLLTCQPGTTVGETVALQVLGILITSGLPSSNPKLARSALEVINYCGIPNRHNHGIRNARGFSARFSSIALSNGNQINRSRFLRDQKPVARGIKKAGRYLGQHKLLPIKDDLGPWRRSEQETR